MSPPHFAQFASQCGDVTGLLFLRTKGIYLLDVIHIFIVKLRGIHVSFLGLFSYLPKRIILAGFFQPQNPDQTK